MNINVMAADQFQAVAPLQPAASVTRTGEQKTAAAPSPPVKTGDIQPEQVKEAVQQIEQFTQTVAQNLKFSIDEDTGKTVVRIMDSQTNELIRQIPSEEAINIARTLGKIEGLLFNDQA